EREGVAEAQARRHARARGATRAGSARQAGSGQEDPRGGGAEASGAGGERSGGEDAGGGEAATEGTGDGSVRGEGETMSAQEFIAPPVPQFWVRVTKFNRDAVALADNHYTRRKRGSPQFMPPGETVVLLTEDKLAVFGWWRPAPSSGIPSMNGLDGWTC